jgi:hypothetical protein
MDKSRHAFPSLLEHLLPLLSVCLYRLHLSQAVHKDRALTDQFTDEDVPRDLVPWPAIAGLAFGFLWRLSCPGACRGELARQD